MRANFHSTHNIIDVSLTWVKQPLDNIRPIEYRNYKDINPSDLAEFLCACDWSSFTNSTNIDTDAALNCLYDNLTRAIEQLAPVKTLKPKKNKLPWAGAELNRLQQKRDAAYRRYKRTRDKFFLEQFSSFRQTADDLATQAGTSYYQNRLTEALANGNVWKELKDLGLLSKPDEDLNGLTPDELNQHFARVSVSPQDSDWGCRDVLNTAIWKVSSSKRLAWQMSSLQSPISRLRLVERMAFLKVLFLKHSL